MMRIAITCFVLAIGCSALSADSARPEILDRIRDYDLRHSDLLVKIVRDNETLRYAKVRALEKIAVIYQQSPREAETTTPRYLEALHVGFASPANDVREAACRASIVFKDSTISQYVVVALAKALKEETNAAAVYACARSLGVYTNPNYMTVVEPALTEKVEYYLKNFQSDSLTEKALTEVCRALGNIKSRKAFIPLLKVLQSRYDEDVKEVAQESLHAIRAQ